MDSSVASKIWRIILDIFMLLIYGQIMRITIKTMGIKVTHALTW